MHKIFITSLSLFFLLPVLSQTDTAIAANIGTFKKNIIAGGNMDIYFLAGLLPGLICMEGIVLPNGFMQGLM